MKTKRVLYVGEKPGVHDQRFIDILETAFHVKCYFTSDSNSSKFQVFENFDLIVAAPLTSSISIIPAKTTTPIVGISLAYDVNSSADIGLLSENIHRCQLIITDCNYVQELITSKYNYPKGKVAVVPYGCDLSTFHYLVERDFREPKILVTRNWTYLHSNILIVEALKILHENEFEFSCIFLGDGPELRKVKSANSHLPFFSRLEFLGNKSPSEIATLMQASNFYVSASTSDGSSVSLMEALASGMVCLVSDFPSNLEWITNRESGFLFKNGSSENLAGALSEILTKSSFELSALAAEGQRIALRRADWNRNKLIFLEMIETTLRVIRS